MDRTIYTIGYGNDKPEDFLNRLSKAKIELVIDVRRRSKARLRCYDPSESSDKGMPKLLTTRNIDYGWAIYLGNPFKVTNDRSKSQCLTEYNIWVSMELKKKEAKDLFFLIIYDLNRYRIRTAFLCAERSAVINGHRNCHRAIVAEKFTDAIFNFNGEQWSVKHL